MDANGAVSETNTDDKSTAEKHTGLSALETVRLSIKDS